ncbi:MAG: DNA polymerase III subunit delta' [Sulfuricaulis sp.]
MAGNNTALTGFTDASELYPWHENLRSALARQHDRLPHALLFYGQPGLGKHAFAVQLAKAMLCERPVAGVACGRCRGCQLLAAGTHPDLASIGLEEDAKMIVVDQIRALGDFLSMRPHTATHKLVIISPAERMNANAANSLLKSLEEPPLDNVLLLVTSHPARLPATIRSRCSQILFKPPPSTLGLNWLRTRPGAPDQPERLLEMAGGAPLLADTLGREGFAEERVKMTRDLEALRSGREDPVVCAARWKILGARRALGWLYGFVLDTIKSQMGVPPTALTNPEAGGRPGNEKNKYKISELYIIIDVIHENYRLLGGPLDELLILEDVLIRWARLSRLQ